jgi:hypothetical protein
MEMRVNVMMAEPEIKKAITEYVERNYGITIASEQLVIWVKSTQNYKSEWEHAAIKIEADCAARSRS